MFRKSAPLNVVVRVPAWGRWCVWLVTAPLALAGCGSSQEPGRLPVYPTSGRLVFDGRPLGGAYVVLHPKKSGDGRTTPRPHAQAAADGSFTLTSYESNDGAPAGDYAVTVELRSLVNHGGDITAGPNTLPPKFSRADSTPVAIQIAEGRNDLPPIQITK